VISVASQSGLKSFFSLYRGLRALAPDMSIIYFAPWWGGLACWLAGVSNRVGRYSQWWSYLFLNKGLRQKRSLSEKHELEYNLELSLYALNEKAQEDDRYKPLRLNPPPLRHLLEQHSLNPFHYIVIHPGMKGSALNWSKSNYLKLAQELSQSHHIVITGTQADFEWVSPLMESLKNNPNVTFLYNNLNLKELLYVLQHSKCVVAPSTGVAHLAASVGSRVIGLYPDLVSQSPKRWKPLGPHVTILTSNQPQLSGITVEQVKSLCLQ
jgi:ADP-heptose:LPS heptosyltransferase